MGGNHSSWLDFPFRRIINIMVQDESPVVPVNPIIPMKKKKKKKSNNMLTLIKMIGRIGLVLLCLFIFSILLLKSNDWCRYTDVFNISAIDIQGNRILTNREILDMANVGMDSSIFSLNLIEIQNRLEKNPYIEAASVSREFPNRVNILLSERIPICYLNHNELFLVDADGIILPVPDHPLNTNLPVISGFDNDSLDYISGYYVPNDAVREIIRVLDATLTSAPQLYSEISEIHYWNNSSFILYTIKNGTPIYLGDKNLPDQLNILANFQNRLKGKRDLSDYQYLDLRWNKQIVAKEKHS